jgi:retron-type reverse transcriptase
MLGKSKYKRDALMFAKDTHYNIRSLIERLKDGTYQMDEYIYFKVYEPKEREIYAPRFKDKMVQVMANNILKKIYNKCFIKDSYACIDEKGTHKALNKIQHYLRKAYWISGNKAFIVKIDIHKYFYSIDRDLLKRILRKKIRCVKTLNLLDQILDSSPDEKGLPLGNITSHLFANIYLNELDRYCKRKMGLKYYVRYMDDIVIIVKDREEARCTLYAIKRFVENELKLKLNNKKSKIFPIDQGVNMVGFKIQRTHKLLRNDCKKKIKRKVKKLPALLNSEQLTDKKVEQMLNSWLGHARHGSSYNFIQKICSANWLTYRCNKIEVAG